MSDLSWPSRPLHKLVDYLGSGISRPFYSKQEGVPVLRSSNVKGGIVVLDDLKYWHETDPRGADLSLVMPRYDDLLVNFVNGSSSELGKAALYKGVPKKCIASTNLFIVRFNKELMIPEFANLFFQSGHYYRWLYKVAGFSGQGSFNSQEFKKLELPCPPTNVQANVVREIAAWNRAIDLTARLIIEKKELRRELIERLVTGRKRLPGFSAPWKQQNLGGFFKEFSALNRDNEDLVPLSCSTIHGIVPQSVIFDKRVASEDIRRYKIVERGDLVYDPMLLWDASIGFQESVDKGAISPAYCTFKLLKGIIERDFFKFLFKSHYMRHQYKVISQGTNMRRRKAPSEAFLSIAIPLPTDSKEQQAVLNVLRAATTEVERLENYRDQLKMQKKGLMQQLLNRKKRVKL